MIIFNTKLVCGDNTDVRKVRCIKILGNSKKKIALISSVIRVAIYIRKFKKEIIKKKVYFNVIINVKQKHRRSSGTFLKFDRNRSLNLSEQLKFLGSRVYGPICKEIRNSVAKKLQFKKLISYSCSTL
jgi:large subunit ribosomal protein L14